jgi:hypothetical protein
MNSRVYDINEPITARYHHRNNTAIPDFPTTSADVADLCLLELNNILRALGTPNTGTFPERILRLRQNIGLNEG